MGEPGPRRTHLGWGQTVHTHLLLLSPLHPSLLAWSKVTQALGSGEMGHISASCQEKGQELSAVVTALQASPGPLQKPG